MGRVRRGFTLIELLVVIAIIAILAAILFPVFAKAREKARQSSCNSNVKQLTIGMLQYVQDYDEKFPDRGHNTSIGWQDWITNFSFPYVKSAQCYQCPSTKDYSYGYRQDGNMVRRTLSEFGSPAETVMISDVKKCLGSAGAYFDRHLDRPGDTGQFPTQPPQLPANDSDDQPVAGDGTYAQRPRGVHNEGANVSFVDGHVKWLRTTHFFYGQSPVDRYFDLN